MHVGWLVSQDLKKLFAMCLELPLFRLLHVPATPSSRIHVSTAMCATASPKYTSVTNHLILVSRSPSVYESLSQGLDHQSANFFSFPVCAHGCDNLRVSRRSSSDLANHSIERVERLSGEQIEGLVRRAPSLDGLSGSPILLSRSTVHWRCGHLQ
jgi:hypothetical protein